jgi:hypothetical protein
MGRRFLPYRLPLDDTMPACSSLFVPGTRRLPQQLIEIGLPAKLPHVDPAGDNFNVFHRKKPALFIILCAALGKSDPARRLDHAVPWHVVPVGLAPECPADLSGPARYPGQFGDLAITRNASFRDFANHVQNPACACDAVHRPCASANAEARLDFTPGIRKHRVAIEAVENLLDDMLRAARAPRFAFTQVLRRDLANDVGTVVRNRTLGTRRHERRQADGADFESAREPRTRRQSL